MGFQYTKDTSKLKLSKIIKGRKKWRDRSNLNQAEKRKCQDRIRYLEECLKNKDEQLSQLNQEINILKKPILIKEPETSNKRVCSIPVSINIQVISIFLFKYGIISFRAIPRVIEVLFKFLGFSVNNCHFASVINWVIKFGAYKLSQTSFLSDAWTAIIDASIEWGNKKMLVVLDLLLSHQTSD